jgi:hypothetical protein
VPVRSLGLGESRGVTENISLRQQPILHASDIRAFEPGTALLLASGMRPARIRLRTWFTGPRRAEIERHIAHAVELIKAGASAADKALR